VLILRMLLVLARDLFIIIINPLRFDLRDDQNGVEITKICRRRFTKFCSPILKA
jgi:hypothetical protein